MKLRILVCLFCLIAAADNICEAQIFLEHGKIEHEIRPNQNVRGNLVVHNTSDTEMSVSVYLEDFQYIEPYEGAKKFFPAGTIDKSLSQWITYSPQQITLPPYSKEKISYSIDTPADVSGGYYGVLFVEKEAVKSVMQKGLSIVARVGCLFFLEGENKNISVGIDKITVGDNKILTTIENRGDVVVIPESVYYLLGEDGIAVDRGDIKDVYLPPEKAVEVEVDMLEDLDIGKYTLVMTFDFDHGNVFVREVDIEKGTSGLNIIEIRN